MTHPVDMVYDAPHNGSRNLLKRFVVMIAIHLKEEDLRKLLQQIGLILDNYSLKWYCADGTMNMVRYSEMLSETTVDSA